MVSGGGAVLRAAEKLKRKLRAVAAARWEVDPEKVRFTVRDGTGGAERVDSGAPRGDEGEGAVRDGSPAGGVDPAAAPAHSRDAGSGSTVRDRAGNGAARLGIAELAHLAHSPFLPLPAGVEPGLEVHAAYDPPGVPVSCAAHVALVEVDRRTGAARVLRYVVAEDCGPIINPAAVDGQIRGAVAQGNRVRAPRVRRLRRGRPAPLRDPDGLPRSVGRRRAPHRHRAHGDPVPVHRERDQGDGRVRDHRCTRRGGERGARRPRRGAGVARAPPHPRTDRLPSSSPAPPTPGHEAAAVARRGRGRGNRRIVRRRVRSRRRPPGPAARRRAAGSRRGHLRGRRARAWHAPCHRGPQPRGPCASPVARRSGGAVHAGGRGDPWLGRARGSAPADPGPASFPTTGCSDTSSFPSPPAGCATSESPSPSSSPVAAPPPRTRRNGWTSTSNPCRR